MLRIYKKIGGEKIQLSTAIPFGVEPHEWEPSPQKITELNKADIIIYNRKGSIHGLISLLK